MKLKIAATSLLALAFATSAAPVLAKDAAPAAAASTAQADAPAPLSELIDAVSIPYESFKLDNGLTVLVHTDRKAPVVAVSVWYGVGSKNEPKGKTGFAHLFEHLMFNGSEHAPGDFFEPLQQVGATDFNGTTWFDRTNYFETVPTGALDLALMLESDRMGYLLGAVTQEKLDNQRSVVQNEKRQGDNAPFGMVEYEQLENLYPSGHPYHHSTIGSMADLDSASLDDVKGWFRDHYGPNNAILVLAGDIDVPTAKAKVAKWFGAIPAGPKVHPVAAPVPDLAAPVTKVIYDQVPTTRIYRMWAVPGLDNPDYIPLSMGASVLGGLASSRLDNELVRKKQLAVRVSASADIFGQAGQFVIFADAKPGVSDEELGAAIDGVIGDFLKNGPTQDELQRATTSYASGQIRGLESVGGFGGKAPTLAEGLLYSGDPAHYKKELKTAAAMTPAQVRDVTAKWLSRPVFTLVVKPGERKEGGEARGGYVTDPAGAGRQPAHFVDPAFAAEGAGAVAAAGAPEADRSTLPAVGDLKPLDFPAIERATLSNGIKVYFARRDAVPVVNVRVAFDAGYSADPIDAPGVQSMMLSLMDEGTTNLDSTQLAEARERLGARIYGAADADTTSFGLDAVTPNLGASLDLLAQYIRQPAFDAKELERVRTQQVNRIDGELNNPGALGQRALAKVLFGPEHPYGMPPSGLGDKAVVAKVTRDDLVRFHSRWITPTNAKIFVVGDTTLEEIMPLLEKSFGQWKANKMAPPVKKLDAAIPTQTPRIILIDRPASPQSVILAGRVLPFKGTDDLVALTASNEVFGGNFLSRINMDLRETKGWSYGVRSLVRNPLNQASWLIYAPVQADRTGDSITALLTDLAAYTGSEGVKGDELERLINGNVRELPGQFETSRDVLGGVGNIITYGRPDDYYESLAAKYKGLTAEELDAQARASFKADDLVFVVVGDAKVVRPQLDKLGWTVETMPSPATAEGK
ncbi:MAG: insulinase family protein [Sphingomonadales bacterium]|nr:insulinase family protein [Sphingomonadales bacterium]MBD3773663.1 insulinase family protein [Paracoccaceae bacterium]